MTTRPRAATPRSGRGSAPALVAVPTAVEAMRTATKNTLSVSASPGPVVGSVCTGYGGLDLGVLAALGGGCVAWCADPDPHIAQVLAARMPGVPNLGDVRAIDWTQVEPVKVLTAGFPCQDISAAGKREGIQKGNRSGLWTDIMAGVRVLRPALLVVENVAALRWRNGGLHRVLGDLAEAGYDALWRSVRAADIGAAHRRERVFLLAWPRTSSDADAADPASPRRRQPRSGGPGAASRRWAPSESSRRGGRGDETLSHAPTAWDVKNCTHRTQGGGPSLPDEARPLPTPRASDTGTAGRRTGQGFRPPLSQQVLPLVDPEAFLPTPRATNGTKGAGATRLQRRPDVAFGSHAPAHLGGRPHLVVAVTVAADHEPTKSATNRHRMDWGDYSVAVRRWEEVLGRGVPFPTQPGTHGRPVLAPVYVEWLQGLERGWVTSLPLPHTAQLRALGNGVIPQQAARAVTLLLADLAALLGRSPSAGVEVRAA